MEHVDTRLHKVSQGKSKQPDNSRKKSWVFLLRKLAWKTQIRGKYQRKLNSRCRRNFPLRFNDKINSVNINSKLKWIMTEAHGTQRKKTSHKTN